MKKLLLFMSAIAMMLVSCTQPVQEELIEEPSIVTPVDDGKTEESDIQTSDENKSEEKSKETVDNKSVQEIIEHSDVEKPEKSSDSNVIEEPEEDANKAEKPSDVVEKPSDDNVIKEPEEPSNVEKPADTNVIEEPSDSNTTEKPEEDIEEKLNNSDIKESEEPSDDNVIEEPSDSNIAEEPEKQSDVVEEPSDDNVIEEPEEDVEEPSDDNVIEEPEEDTWIEVKCFDDVYGLDYVIFPEELDVTSGYRFENNTNPSNSYNLFKFEYVKSLVLNNESSEEYVLNGKVKTTDSCYKVVKCYKLYVNAKYEDDELIIVYPDVYITNNWMRYSLGYQIEKADNDFSLRLATYNGYRKSLCTYQNDNYETLKNKAMLLKSYYKEIVSEND